MKREIPMNSQLSQQIEVRLHNISKYTILLIYLERTIENQVAVHFFVKINFFRSKKKEEFRNHEKT